MELLQTAIDFAKEKGEYESAHYLAGKLGNVYFQIMAQYALAVEAYTESLEYARQMGDLKREAILLSLVATARFKAGLDGVEDFYEQASEAARKSGDQEVAATIYNHRSYHANEKTPPDFEAGIRFVNQAIKIAKEHELYDIAFASILNRGKSEYHIGLVEDALASDLEAYDLAKRLNNNYSLTYAAKALAWLYHQLEDREKAGKHFREAYILAKQIENTAIQQAIEDQVNQLGYLLDNNDQNMGAII